MQQTSELEQITIKLQHNGEGTVGFQHRIRVRDDAGERIADGDSVQARITLAAFREQTFEVNGKNITGAEFQTLCGLIADEMEKQAEARDRANREAEERARGRKAAIEAEQQRLAEEQAQLAAEAQQVEADAAAEAERIAAQHRGRAERGG